MKDMPWEAFATALVFALAAGAAWRWQEAVRHRHPVSALTESWEQAQEQFPMPPPLSSDADSSGTGRPRESLLEVVKANPFSPQRRTVPPSQPSAASAGGASTSSAAQAATLMYKGRVALGATQRAIVEDVAAKKTYFLQVGQEVAGYKVLDISETEVVLSSSTTQETLTLRLTPKP